ncbi:zinc-binding dehydrogenase [Amaricoccus tamworthensis]|uniref:zinc-binding dehydrogenase n=1 Tax=Amaricoccus tamworthensis TaxID=57002 RepID=UPI003C7C2E37
MKAAVCRGFGEPLVIEDVFLDPPGKGQIQVRLAACAICHSDISAAAGAWGGTLPAVYGHEASGVVEAVGEGVEGFAEGEKVLVTLIRSCGHCPACDAGALTSCDDAWHVPPSPLRSAVGEPVVQGINCGAFAENVVVDQSQCIGLPDDIPLDVASLLACGVITGYGAVMNTAKIQPGQSVAVVGAGGVGLNCIQGAVIAGARSVIAVDLTPEKLDTAASYGATAGVLAGEEAHKAVKEANGGRGVDAVFVSVGSAAAIGAAVRFLAPGGSVIVVGMPPTGSDVAFDAGILAALNHKIVGARMGETVLKRDIPILLEHYRSGALKLDELISGRFPLEAINTAIASTRSGIAGRNVIVFDDVSP